MFQLQRNNHLYMFKKHYFRNSHYVRLWGYLNKPWSPPTSRNPQPSRKIHDYLLVNRRKEYEYIINFENFVNIECHTTRIRFKNSSCLRHTCPAINSGIFYHHYVSANVCVTSTWQNLLVSSPTPPFSDHTSWHYTWSPGKNNHSLFGDYLIPYPDSTHLNLIH